MRAPIQYVPRVPAAAYLRVEMNITATDQAGKNKAKQRRKRRPVVRSAPSKVVPAGNIRAQKKQADIRAATNAIPPVKSTRESTKSKK